MERSNCHICPHNCKLLPGEVGKCLVRQNIGNKIVPIYEGECALLATEPIEKRPLFHFLPGEDFLAVGMLGCSLSCKFCVTGDTFILTPNGLKRIDQIAEGDEILAVDGSTDSPQRVLARVGHIFDREVQEVLELEVDGQTIRLTPEHPVLTKQRGWVKAGCLTEGDEVLCDKTYLK